MTFEVEGLAFIDSTISSSDKWTPRELILGLTGLSEENKEEKIFISVEKDYRGNVLLVYKKKYYKNISTMADFLTAIMIKQYDKNILSIFQPYYQDAAINVIWIDGIPMTAEEKDLEDILGKELDWLEIDKVETISNKCFCPTLENDALVDTFTIKDFGLLPTNSDIPEINDNVEMESVAASAQDPQRSLAPK